MVFAHDAHISLHYKKQSFAINFIAAVTYMSTVSYES